MTIKSGQQVWRALDAAKPAFQRLASQFTLFPESSGTWAPLWNAGFTPPASLFRDLRLLDAMTQAKPTLDRKAAEQINLNVLKRLDPAIEEVSTIKSMQGEGE